MRVALKTRHAKHAEPDPSGTPRGFSTPWRRVELYSQVFLERGYAPLPDFGEPPVGPVARRDPAASFPLILTSAKSSVYCESQHRMLRSLRKHAPYPGVTLHPVAAQARGIADGDWVSIETPEGRVRARASFNENLDPRVVLASTAGGRPAPELGLPGYDPFEETGANLNLLIGTGARDPVSGTAAHKSYLCIPARDPAAPATDRSPGLIPLLRMRDRTRLRQQRVDCGCGHALRDEESHAVRARHCHTTASRRPVVSCPYRGST